MNHTVESMDCTLVDPASSCMRAFYRFLPMALRMAQGPEDVTLEQPEHTGWQHRYSDVPESTRAEIRAALKRHEPKRAIARRLGVTRAIIERAVKG